MRKVILYRILAYAAYYFLISDETGCAKYASAYSCKYVIEKANYDVYYWRNLDDDNADDEQLVGSVIGLQSCEALAVRYGQSMQPSSTPGRDGTRRWATSHRCSSWRGGVWLNMRKIW